MRYLTPLTKDHLVLGLGTLLVTYAAPLWHLLVLNTSPTTIATLGGGDGMEPWLAAIKDAGFPIFAASYVLLRIDKNIQGLSTAIATLSDWLKDHQK
jgi:hypothetical protein